MSLDIQRIARDGVNVAFATLTNLLETVTIITNESATYDTATGTVTKSEGSLTVRGIFVSIKENDSRYAMKAQLDTDSVGVADKKLLLKKEDVPIEVKKDSVIVRVSDSSRWSVVKTLLDPTESLYEIMIRSAV